MSDYAALSRGKTQYEGEGEGKSTPSRGIRSQATERASARGAGRSRVMARTRVATEANLPRTCPVILYLCVRD